MKKTSSNLYKLIGELSKQEKKHINIALSNEIKGNLKLLLFKEVCSTEIKSFDKFEHNITYTKNITKLKSDLYATILKQLVVYSAVDSEAISLKKALIQIDVLFNKNLVKQCDKLITKTLKKAAEIEDFKVIAELYEWKCNLLVESNNPKELKKFIGKDLVALEKLKIERHFINTNHNIYLLQSQKIPLKNKLEKIHLLLTDSLFTEENSKTSFATSVFYHQSFAFYHFYSKDWGELYYNTKNILASAVNRKDTGVFLVNALSSHITACVKTSRLKEFENTCDLLLSNPTDSKLAEYKQYENYIAFKLGGLIELGEIQRAVELEGDYKKSQTDEVKQMSSERRLKIHFLFSVLFLLSGDYKKGLQYVNSLLHDDSLSEQTELHDMGTLINLLIHYKLTNYDLATSLFATYKRNAGKSAFERWFIPFYAQLLKGELTDSFYRVEEQKLLTLINAKNVRFIEDSRILLWVRLLNGSDSLAKLLASFNLLGTESYKEERLEVLKGV